MDISERIQEIIARRQGVGSYMGKGHIDAVRKKKAFYEALLQCLENYQTFRNNVIGQISSQHGEYYTMSVEDPLFHQSIETASPDETITLTKSALKELMKLETRFSRDTLNISVIGRARQGKSRLLQSISGLPDIVIPASNGGDCTGAKSVIVNSESTMYAKICFYDEMEMVEQVQKYLDAVGISRKIGSLSQIPSLASDISVFEAELPLKSGRVQSLFGHLCKYVYYFSEYRDYVGKTIEEHDELKIRNYVAQYDVEMCPTYKFLAVKEVQIFTDFNCAYAKNLVLVDTIGLGDTSLGIREKMIKTLRNDSDAAILVRLPNANGDSIRVEDDELYDLICEAMGKEALNKWLFFALNVCDELGNHNSGAAMEKALQARKLNFAFTQKVNCGDDVEVKEKLLEPILQYLSDNLAEVDNKMLEETNVILENCYQSFFSLCGKVDQLSQSTFMESLNTGGLFDKLYEDELALPAKLEALSAKYKGHDVKCEEIENEIKNRITSLVTKCPSQEDILKDLNAGTINAHADIVYQNKADHFRASISDMFEEINKNTVVKLQEGIKDEIADVLRSDEGGKLNAVPLNLDTDNPTNIEWLEAFVSEKLNDYPLIKEAFNNILEYRLNIEGLLEYKINSCLECLDPEDSKFIKQDFSYDESKEESAANIEQALLSSVFVLGRNIVDSVQDLLRIPYNSFYARIRKLRERIIYSKDGERELKNMYREFAVYIWKERFAAMAKKQGAMKELNTIQELFVEKRSKNLFTIKI